MVRGRARKNLQNSRLEVIVMKRLVLTLVLGSVVLGIAVHTRAARLCGPRSSSRTSVPLVPNYDLAPDGKRIAALMPAEAPGEAADRAEPRSLLAELLRRTAPAGAHRQITSLAGGGGNL